MATKRISDAMEKALNAQMTQEAWQAQVYLSYAAWAEENHYAGISDFLYKHAHEEREHMFKILKFIINRGGKVKVDAIKAAPANHKDLGDCLKKLLGHEVDNSKLIDQLTDLAHKEKDWAALNFAQWFVKEQVEEETLFGNLLDKYVLATTKKEGNANLYEFDRDVANAPQETTIPQEEKF
ncbi:MAG: ferritin [Flavobacteriales bacterium]